jgi:hypothetical protein
MDQKAATDRKPGLNLISIVKDYIDNMLGEV